MKSIFLCILFLSSSAFSQEIKVSKVDTPVTTATTNAIASKITEIPSENRVVIEDPRLQFSTSVYGYTTFAFDEWSVRFTICNVFGYKRIKDEDTYGHAHFAEGQTQKLPLITNRSYTDLELYVEFGSDASTPYLSDSWISSVECALNP